MKELLDNCASCITKPCQAGCPLSNDITGFIKLMKEEKYKEAYDLLCNTTVLPSICGRICPQSKQCQSSCVKRFVNNPVKIGDLEAMLGDMAIENNWDIPKFTDSKNGKSIAIVGGGPAGLTCAAFLARNGFEVTIYEKHSCLGGVIEHGIPEFRLDRKVLEDSINQILKLDIKVKYNRELGKDFSLDDLEQKYYAIFLCFGKNVSSKMGIEGEDKEGVLGGNNLLENKEYLDFKGKNVTIIGGGNVAMDICRTIKRSGANKVTVVYRRSEEEMQVDKSEIDIAKKEGVEFLFQTNIIKILGDNKVEKIECIKTELVQKENQDRKFPINIEGSNFVLNVDNVIMAIGSTIQKNLVDNMGLKINDRGTVDIDESYMTSREKIFAGGDLADSKGTVARAARSGRNAAYKIR